MQRILESGDFSMGLYFHQRFEIYPSPTYIVLQRSLSIGRVIGPDSCVGGAGSEGHNARDIHELAILRCIERLISCDALKVNRDELGL